MVHERKSQVMIVDDAPSYITIFKEALGGRYDLTIATNGADALRKADAAVVPDLILLDVMMPDMDGFTVCRKLKENKRTRNIPIIFLTAKSELDDLVKGFEAGAVDYITKPFFLDEVLARVQTHIDLMRARKEIDTLRGILPICFKCKKVRDDQGYWEQIEVYIENHSEALFSHSLCPDCNEALYGEPKAGAPESVESGPNASSS